MHDATHTPRHVKCFVCKQSDSEEFMEEVSGNIFVHDPECLEDYSNWLGAMHDTVTIA